MTKAHYLAVLIGILLGLSGHHIVKSQVFADIVSGKHQRMAMYIATMENGIQESRRHADKVKLPANPFQYRG